MTDEDNVPKADSQSIANSVDADEPAAVSEDNRAFDEVMKSIRVRHAAFEMYLAGYRKRVQDEKEQPSSLRNIDDFHTHVRDDFERKWADVDPDK